MIINMDDNIYFILRVELIVMEINFDHEVISHTYSERVMHNFQ